MWLLSCNEWVSKLGADEDKFNYVTWNNYILGDKCCLWFGACNSSQMEVAVLLLEMYVWITYKFLLWIAKRILKVTISSFAFTLQSMLYNAIS